MHLLEMFNSNRNIIWASQSNLLWKSSFMVGDLKYLIRFDAHYTNLDEWHVAFRIADDYIKDPYGNTGQARQFSTKVFGEVIAYIQEFLIKENPKILRFSGEKSDFRDVLYRKIIKFLSQKIKKLGYRVREKNEGDVIFFDIVRNDPEKITELFDTTGPISPKWHRIGRKFYELGFEINGQKYSIELRNNIKTNRWNISFEDSFGNWGTTGSQKQNAPKVFGVVVNSIADFAKNHDAEGFRFFGFNDSGKDVFYIAMMKYMAKKMSSLGYECNHKPINDTGIEFILTKKNHIEEGFSGPPNLRAKILKLVYKYSQENLPKYSQEIPLSAIFKNPTERIIPMSVYKLYDLYGTSPMIGEKEAQSLPKEIVDISKIILQDQGCVGVNTLLSLLNTTRDIPLIWLEALPGDRFWLVEGHHRLALTVLSGKKTVLANVGRDPGILKQEIIYKTY